MRRVTPSSPTHDVRGRTAPTSVGSLSPTLTQRPPPISTTSPELLSPAISPQPSPMSVSPTPSAGVLDDAVLVYDRVKDIFSRGLHLYNLHKQGAINITEIVPELAMGTLGSILSKTTSAVTEKIEERVGQILHSRPSTPSPGGTTSTASRASAFRSPRR